MTWREMFLDPLRGRTSLSRVIWGYGLLGSVIVSALGLFVDSGNEVARRGYAVLGLLYGVYVSAALYQCARQSRSALAANLLRVSAVASLLLVLLMGYLDFSGALSLLLVGTQ